MTSTVPTTPLPEPPDRAPQGSHRAEAGLGAEFSAVLRTALFSALVCGLLLAVALIIPASSSARGLPVGVVGTQEQQDSVSREAEHQQTPFHTVRLLNRSDAERAVRERRVYAAFLYPNAERKDADVLLATAASPEAADVITRTAAGLGQEVQGVSGEAQRNAALEAARLAAESAAADAAASTLSGTLDQLRKVLPNTLLQLTGLESRSNDLRRTADEARKRSEDAQTRLTTLGSSRITTTDLVPFSERDPRGSVLSAAGLPLVGGAILGGLLLTRSRRGLPRLAGLAVFSGAAGLVFALLAGPVFGALPGPIGLSWLASALGVASIAGLLLALDGVFSSRGTSGARVRTLTFPASPFTASPGHGSLLRGSALAGGSVLMLAGLALSTFSMPQEFLPQPWGTLGRFLPPSALAEVLRNTSYFPDAPNVLAWSVLTVWAVLTGWAASASRPGPGQSR